MLTIEEIKNNYSKFSNEELLKTVEKIKSLRKDVIPVLQTELKIRDLTVGVEKINDYLLEEISKKPNVDFDPKIYIEEQLKEGYSLETIKHKLNHMDIDMFEVLNNEKKDDEFIKQYIKTNKNKGKKIIEIEKELKENFEIPNEKTRAYNEILEKEGRKKIFIGLGLIIFSGISFAIRGGIGISSIILFLLGLWKFIEGSKKA